MDPIAHTLTGYRLGEVGPPSRVGERVVLLVLASLMPDVDFIVARFVGPLGFLIRRSYTHSLLGIVVSSLIAAALLGLFMKQRRYLNILGWLLVGATVHVFMDLWNSYGVVVLHPFCMRRFEYGTVFIIDLYVYGILVAPWLLRRWIPRRAAAVASLALLLGYAWLCGYARMGSSALLASVTKGRAEVQKTAVFPEPFGPQNFRGTVLAGDKIELYALKPFTSGVVKLKEIHTDAANPLARKVAASAEAEGLMWFFAMPVWEVGQGGVVDVYDMRFVSPKLEFRQTPFKFRFVVDGDEIEGPERL